MRLDRPPRAQRTDPIYNRCMICGRAGHCSASCTRVGVTPEFSRRRSAGTKC